ncbi:hypothetical protein A2954_02465 [Candidatus Roizmanbacteria bacterium RIFCSPLOWO2_01_FULL_37_12]|uniref:Antitoxin n=1 Tax=Candidatus Roizmanbacteria bacterium RIFCSPLOWO2_01_FULL_37_12 TaxID=1802056 RepID=A0A1F7IEV2_9BACT|nr:MAG: hypothetical protein A3D76_00095 [Candidatus Roizmanbacteria bacterium RIFCSPHIGHO2_02_FULL_37_9b]OGK41889.1 MAG: hypothetical protein A2954_02465 [Candidatus Roizmanbacteria bacterium RIFCSPLOWO2_01_FULL_37_12]
MNNIVAISDLRKKFGDIEAMLPYVESITITKKGKPFAILSATDEVKRSVIRKYAGAWKNSELDDDKLWKKVLTRKSRRKPIRL